MTEATHMNSTSHDMKLNNLTVAVSVKPSSRERLRAAWQKLTTTKAALGAVVSAGLVAGAVYAAKAYLNRK